MKNPLRAPVKEQRMFSMFFLSMLLTKAIALSVHHQQCLTISRFDFRFDFRFGKIWANVFVEACVRKCGVVKLVCEVLTASRSSRSTWYSNSGQVACIEVSFDGYCHWVGGHRETLCYLE